MKGNPKVIESLNKLLTLELTAIDTYFVQSLVCNDLGYLKLDEHFKHEMEEEKVHSTKLIERILFLEGVPDIATRKPFKVDLDVKGMIELDLAHEMGVKKAMDEVISVCFEQSDHGTRDIVEELLSETENDHILWLETQLRIINEIGIEKYLAEKI